MRTGRDDEEREQALWAATLAGDGDAFGRVFDRHQDRVFAHACRLLEVRADAEDVTATAFFELWRRRHSVRQVEGSVLPWLLVTTSNLSRNVRRSTRRHRSLIDRLPRAPHAQDPAEEHLTLHPDGWDAGLIRHLRSMSQTDLTLVTLIALEGYPLVQAAEFLGLSLPAAKSRLHRVRRRQGLFAHPSSRAIAGRTTT